MKNKNAFAVYVFGSYEKYIPYYIYFINLNYPEVDILIFYQDTLSDNIKKALKGLDNYILYEKFINKEFIFEGVKIKGGDSKLNRWLLPKELMSSYKYVYMGDVDILILKETESLFEFHKNQAKKFDLPFSNKVRILSDGRSSKRLTGLHFIEVNSYYDCINFTLQKLNNDKQFKINFFKDIYRDEHFLYKLVKNNIAFDDKLLFTAIRPWHGFHIGIVRGGLKMSKEQINENSSIPFEEIKRQLTLELENESFIKLFKNSFCLEVYWSFLQFDIKLPFTIRVAYFNYKMNRFINKVKYKLIR